MLGGLIGKGIAGGVGKGLMKGAGGGIGQGLLKGAGGGGGGPLKGLLGGGEGGGLLGKALEAIGGPQGIMDLVQQIIDAAKNGQDQNAQPAAAGLNPGAGAPAPQGAAPQAAAPQAAAPQAAGPQAGGAGGAPGAQGAPQDRGQKLLMRLAQKLADAKTPQDVDNVLQKLGQRLEAKGKATPEVKELLQQLGQMRKASLQQAA